jgi:hypothetical protein
MKKINKSTPFLMILVLSLITSQLFLRAFGVNVTPSLGTMMKSWGKVASTVGFVYQPGFVAELDVLSNHFFCTEGKAPVEGEKPCGELACNRSDEFEFEPPPFIESKVPTWNEEGQGEGECHKPLRKIILKSAGRAEVLEIAADAEESAPDAEDKAETFPATGATTFTVELTGDTPEAEFKSFPNRIEGRVYFTNTDAQVAPKAEKTKKPCPEQENLRRLEETKKLVEEMKNNYEFQQENVFKLNQENFVKINSAKKLVEELKANCELEAFQALKNFEKSKRMRFTVRIDPRDLPRLKANESFNVNNVAEESEF